MKKSIIAFVVLCGFIAGAVVYLTRQKTSLPDPAPVVATSPGETAAQIQPETMVVTRQELPQANPANAGEAGKISPATPVVGEAKSGDSTNSIGKLVDALLTAKGAGQKHELFEQLQKAGRLNEAIAELQQMMAQNPGDPEIPTTLGEAQLNEVRAIHETSGDNDQMGILAMQADQNFNAALKINPSNWEAQFVKAASMYYWPADATRDNEVVQRLSGLIDQQETMTLQPQFAQTYVVLGNEYQTIGQPDKAQATWQLGLTKFPSDSTLLKKVNGP